MQSLPSKEMQASLYDPSLFEARDIRLVVKLTNGIDNGQSGKKAISVKIISGKSMPKIEGIPDDEMMEMQMRGLF